MGSKYRPLSHNNRGPRSRAGKAAAALNSLKHGLEASSIVLPSEDAAEWQRFHDDVLACFDVQGPVEAALASRVAECLWRLRRVTRAEQQAVAVGQMHRDTLVLDREQLASTPGSEAGESRDDPDFVTLALRRQELAGKLGFYATALIADSAASRLCETLPVLLPDDRALEMLMRYEGHLSRLLNHALHELEALQDRRRGNATPLARLDIG